MLWHKKREILFVWSRGEPGFHLGRTDSWIKTEFLQFKENEDTVPLQEKKGAICFVFFHKNQFRSSGFLLFQGERKPNGFWAVLTFDRASASWQQL